MRENKKISLVGVVFIVAIAITVLFANRTNFLLYHELRVLLLGDRTDAYQYTQEKFADLHSKQDSKLFGLKWYFRPEARFFHDDTGARVNPYYPEAIVDDADLDGNAEVYIASYSKKVYCLDGKTGKGLWEYKLPFGITAGVSAQLIDVDNDGVKELIFGTHAPLPIRIYCIRTGKDIPDDRRLVWHKDIHGDFLEGGLTSFKNASGAARIVYATKGASYMKGSLGVLDGKGRNVNRPTYGVDTGMAKPSIYLSAEGMPYAITGSHNWKDSNYEYSGSIIAKNTESGDLGWVTRLGWDMGAGPMMIADINFDGKKEVIYGPVNKRYETVILDHEDGQVLGYLPYKYKFHFKDAVKDIYVISCDEKGNLYCLPYIGNTGLYGISGDFSAVRYLLDIDSDGAPEFLKEDFGDSAIKLLIYDALSGKIEYESRWQTTVDDLKNPKENYYDHHVLADCDNDRYWELITFMNGFVVCFDTSFPVKRGYPPYHIMPYGNTEGTGCDLYNNFGK